MASHYTTLLLAGILALGARAAFASPAPVITEPPTILDASKAKESVTVEDIHLEGDHLSGVIVNREPHPLRSVRLVIGEVYRWPNEYRPGGKSPNRAKTVVVEQEVPAGGRVSFSTTFPQATPPGPGGDFTTQVYVMGFTEVLPPNLPSVASPASR